jgi:hypothetical protein
MAVIKHCDGLMRLRAIWKGPGTGREREYFMACSTWGPPEPVLPGGDLDTVGRLPNLELPEGLEPLHQGFWIGR